VRVDGVDDLVERRLEGPADRELVDQLGGLRPDDVHAQDLAGGLVGHHLDEALGVTLRHRLAAGRERELADRDLAGARPGRRLREPDGGDLRVAIGAGRHVAVVHRPRRLSGDRLRRHHTLRHRLVSQQLVAGHVPDRVDALDRRLHRRRHGHEPALGRHPGRLESEAAGLCGASHRHQHLVGLEGLGLALRLHRHRDALGARRDPLDLHAGADPDVAAGEEPGDLGGDFLVLDRQHPRQRLQHGHP
jgi:hypothetical protein